MQVRPHALHPTRTSRALRVGLLAALPLVPAGCDAGGSGPEIVDLGDEASIDEEVASLVRVHVARARAEPGDAQRRADLALVYEANEFWDEARRSWAGALDLEPARPIWRYHLALCSRQAGDNARARAELERVAAEEPTLAAARHRLGEVLLEAGEVEAAQREFQAASELEPQHPGPLVGIAECRLRGEDFRGAAELCRRALGIAPGYQHASYNLGLALRGLGQAEEALQELNKGLEAQESLLPDELSPRIEKLRQSYSVRITQAVDLARAGHPEAAARILEQVIRTHPEDVTALSNLASVYLQTGRTVQAIEHLGRARRLAPDEFAICINLAVAELELGKLAEALGHAQEAVERAPSVGRAWFVRGRAFQALGRFEEAHRDFTKAAELDASHWETHGRLGDVSFQLGILQEAVQHYERALRLRPEELRLHAQLFYAQLALGQRDAAERALGRFRELAPQHAELQRMLAALEKARR